MQLSGSIGFDDRYLQKSNPSDFLLALKLCPTNEISFLIREVSPESIQQTMTIGFVDSRRFDCRLFPFMQTELIFSNVVKSPTVDMVVDIEISDSLLVVKTNGKREFFATVDASATYYPFFLLNGQILNIEFIDKHEDKSTLEDKLMCIVCFEKPPGAAFIDCGHSNCCYTCALDVAQRQKQCPMCRQPIVKVLKLYS